MRALEIISQRFEVHVEKKGKNAWYNMGLATKGKNSRGSHELSFPTKIMKTGLNAYPVSNELAITYPQIA